MRVRWLLLAMAVGLSGCVAMPPGGDALDDLIRVRPGRSRRVSSAAASAASNRDNLWIKPGETCVLADLAGPGVIRHIWLTFSEAAPNWLSAEGSANPSEIVLRMTWDNGEHPAVECPLGDFFAAGFGERSEVNSIPVQVQGGDAYNCYWPMPFHNRALVTITNEGSKRLNAFYYHIDYTQEPLPSGAAYFCAQYRQEFPEQLGRDYLIADIVGQGHYVGTVLSSRSRSPEWFGEGDEQFTIDGEARPSIWGTGTEDFMLSAWGLEKCSFPCFGVPFLDGDWGDVGTRVCAYRWHVADPVRFMRSCRVEIEHAGWLSADETETGKVEGFVEREDDLASVAFWYQVGQPKRFTSLPPASQRALPNLDVMIEARDFIGTARHAGGETVLQQGYVWTGEGQLFYTPAADRDSTGAAGQAGGAATGEAGQPVFLEFDFNVAKVEYRRLILRLTHSYDYGIFRVFLDGREVAGPLNLYSPDIRVHDHSLGDHELAIGTHTLRLVSAGSDPRSTGRRLGVDSVRLRQRWLKKRPVLKP